MFFFNVTSVLPVKEKITWKGAPQPGGTQELHFAH